MGLTSSTSPPTSTWSTDRQSTLLTEKPSTSCAAWDLHVFAHFSEEKRQFYFLLFSESFSESIIISFSYYWIKRNCHIFHLPTYLLFGNYKKDFDIMEWYLWVLSTCYKLCDVFLFLKPWVHNVFTDKTAGNTITF